MDLFNNSVSLEWAHLEKRGTFKNVLCYLWSVVNKILDHVIWKSFSCHLVVQISKMSKLFQNSGCMIKWFYYVLNTHTKTEIQIIGGQSTGLIWSRKTTTLIFIQEPEALYLLDPFNFRKLFYEQCLMYFNEDKKAILHAVNYIYQEMKEKKQQIRNWRWNLTKMDDRSKPVHFYFNTNTEKTSALTVKHGQNRKQKKFWCSGWVRTTDPTWIHTPNQPITSLPDCVTNYQRAFS